MCQFIVGKVIDVNKNKAKVNIKGKNKILDTQLVDVSKGDYVICAADYILEKIDEEEARMILGNVNGNKK